MASRSASSGSWAFARPAGSADRRRGSLPMRWRAGTIGSPSSSTTGGAPSSRRPTPHTARWLRREAEVYTHLHGSFIAELIAFEDGPIEPLLVFEDLSTADWSVRWDANRVAAVRGALDAVAASAPPPNTPPVRKILANDAGREAVRADPVPFLSTGIRSRAWLDRAMPILQVAADAAPIDGNDLLHLDVRSDNLCTATGRRFWSTGTGAPPDAPTSTSGTPSCLADYPRTLFAERFRPQRFVA